MTLKLFVPKSYQELTPKQAKWLFKALVRSQNLNSVEFKTIAFIRFSGLKVITKCYDSGDYIMKSGKTICRIDTAQLAVATRQLDWILFPPKFPWVTERLGGRHTPDPRLYDLPFGQWLAVDNLYQGYLRTLNFELLRKIAKILLPKFHRPLRQWELEVVFRWISSVKEFYSSRFTHFFAGVSDNSLGSGTPSSKQIEDAMNAQIRALTKGDISKEDEILNMPTLRALTELDAQAREYRELEKARKK